MTEITPEMASQESMKDVDEVLHKTAKNKRTAEKLDELYRTTDKRLTTPLTWTFLATLGVKYAGPEELQSAAEYLYNFGDYLAMKAVIGAVAARTALRMGSEVFDRRSRSKEVTFNNSTPEVQAYIARHEARSTMDKYKRTIELASRPLIWKSGCEFRNKTAAYIMAATEDAKADGVDITLGEFPAVASKVMVTESKAQ